MPDASTSRTRVTAANSRTIQASVSELGWQLVSAQQGISPRTTSSRYFLASGVTLRRDISLSLPAPDTRSVRRDVDRSGVHFAERAAAVSACDRDRDLRVDYPSWQPNTQSWVPPRRGDSDWDKTPRCLAQHVLRPQTFERIARQTRRGKQSLGRAPNSAPSRCEARADGDSPRGRESVAKVSPAQGSVRTCTPAARGDVVVLQTVVLHPPTHEVTQTSAVNAELCR